MLTLHEFEDHKEYRSTLAANLIKSHGVGGALDLAQENRWDDIVNEIFKLKNLN